MPHPFHTTIRETLRVFAEVRFVFCTPARNHSGNATHVHEENTFAPSKHACSQLAPPKYTRKSAMVYPMYHPLPREVRVYHHEKFDTSFLAGQQLLKRPTNSKETQAKGGAILDNNVNNVQKKHNKDEPIRSCVPSSTCRNERQPKQPPFKKGGGGGDNVPYASSRGSGLG